jgi:PAS domain-containing protein
VSIETWNNLVHKDDLDIFEKTVDDYFSGKTDIYEIEVRMRHKQGHWVWILDRGKNVEWNENGDPIKMIGTHVDITNLKNNEKRLKENERLLMETQRVANLGTFIEDYRTHQIRPSKILNQMFWLPEGENLTNKRLLDSLHPDFKYIAETYKKAIGAGEPFEAEFKIQNKKDKRERWIYEKANVELDQDGNPVVNTREQQSYVVRGSAVYNFYERHSLRFDASFTNVNSSFAGVTIPNDHVVQLRYIFRF